jgi:hypothetical protein
VVTSLCSVGEIIVNKPFLLIAGSNYYPSSGTDDWKGTFETYEEAKAQMTDLSKEYKDRKAYCRFKFGEEYCDWYEIVDLRRLDE